MVLGSVWLYSIFSVLIVSLISLIGVFTLGFHNRGINKILVYLVSFSAGALLGDAFLHLLPESVAVSGFTLNLSLYVLSGIVIFFVLEKFVHWQHCHTHVGGDHIHPFTYMVLVGDALHNFIDGIVIAASYLVSVPAGIATTIAVLLHEIPQQLPKQEERRLKLITQTKLL